MALGGNVDMFKYVKSLEYPINIKKKDLRMAKYIVTQYYDISDDPEHIKKLLHLRLNYNKKMISILFNNE